MSDQNRVFISYRRPVSTFVASAIYQHLWAREFDVFMDVETTDTEEFDGVLLRQIDARAHFLIILTPGDAHEYAQPSDWQRRKIEHALQTGRNIIPLLVNGFTFADHARHFTGELAAITALEALTVPADYFAAAMDRLQARLVNSAAVSLAPMPPEDAAIVQRKTHRVAQVELITSKHLAAERYFQRAFFAERDTAAKIKDFSEALRILPAYPLAYLYRSNARRVLDDLDGAIDDATAALALQIDNADIYVSRGIAHYLNDDFDAANADYTRALELQPYNAAIYLNRGDAMRAMNRLDEAWANYRIAEKCSPISAEAYQAFCQHWNILPARNSAQTFANFQRYHFMALNNMGEIARLNNEMDVAISLFSEAIALFPQDVTSYISRAETWMQLDDMPNAIADFTRALELDPRNDSLYHQRGFAHHQAGDESAALADYDRALELNGRGMMTYCNRAEIHLALGNYDAALDDWNAAHTLRPGYPLILAGLALTHHSMSSHIVAQDVWQLLTDADNRFSDAEKVGQLFNWQPALIEKTRQLLADLA